MNGPPNFSLEPYQCPNCGLPLRELVEFCPTCGARIENAKRRPQWLSCLMMLVLFPITVTLALAGSCFLIMAPFNGPHWDSLGYGVFGLVLFGAAILCGIAISKLWKQ